MDLKKATSILLICTMIILVFAIMGCSSSHSDYLKEINYKEFENLVNKKETFVLYIGRRTCSSCELFEPKLINIIDKYKVTVYKVDTDKFSKKDYTALMDIISISGTPTIEFYVDGVETSTINRIVGNISEDVIKQKLIDNGYIKE